MRNLIGLLVGLLLATPAFAATPYGDAASSIGIAVTGMYLGTFSSGKCGGWQTVFTNPTAGSENFIQDLNIGSGSVPIGTYDCIALQVTNFLSVSVNSNAGGACVGWTGQQIFSSGQGQSAYDLNDNVIGTNSENIAANGTLYLFFYTSGNGNVFDPSGAAALSQAVTVTATTTTLNFKFVDGATYTPLTSASGITDLQDDSGTCTFNDGNVSFAVSE